MREAEGINFSVGGMGDEGKSIGLRRIRQTTYKDIVSFIKSKNFSTEDENKLLIQAKKIPNGSLDHFKKNYRIYLK